MKRMLINATQQEELRVALVDGQRLYDLDIENSGAEQKKSNIYKGTIVRIEPSLEAAFVDYGEKKNGFLPLKEVSKNYFPENNIYTAGLKIQDVLQEGQEVIVQIRKEERGTKGAALTTFITLVGSYLVLMPNNPKAGGISRRIEGSDRIVLKELFSLLKLPEYMSLIIRTAGAGKSIESLKWDLSLRLQHWNTIQIIAKSRTAPFLIHQESNIIVRAFRDYLRQDIGEILIDNPKILDLARKHITFLGRPDFANKIKLYNGAIPLFSYFQIETQIDSAFQRKVRLPSGGSIMVDSTEALTAIDINSSRSTSGTDIASTAFNTNLEAADEISRQLRLRDLGGLIVIDFIDMSDINHQKAIENRLREIARDDRARIQIGHISRFGLLEMSRQRLSSSLGESSHHVCPRCTGTGTIRDNESLSLSILRLIEEEALKENTHEVRAIVPVEIACYLLNEKRDAVHAIEKRQAGGKTIIVPSKKMKTPHYSVSRIRKGESINSTSYGLSNIRKSKIAHFLKENILKKKRKEKSEITNLSLLHNDYNKIQKEQENFLKKNNHHNIFLKILSHNSKFIFKMITWFKNSFLIKYILITREILKKNSLQEKNNIFLKKKHYSLHKKNIDQKKTVCSSKLFKKNLENIPLKNKNLELIQKECDISSRKHSHLYKKNDIKNIDDQKLSILDTSNVFYNVENKNNEIKNSNLIQKCINKSSCSKNILIKKDSDINIIDHNAIFYKFFNDSKIFNNNTLHNNFLDVYPAHSPISVLSSVFSLELALGKVWIKYPILISDEEKKQKQIIKKKKLHISSIFKKNKFVKNNNYCGMKKTKTEIYSLKKYTKNNIQIQEIIKPKFLKRNEKESVLISDKKNFFYKKIYIRENKTSQSSAPVTKISEKSYTNKTANLFNFNLLMMKLSLIRKNSAGAHSATNISNSPVSKIK
ncbi:MAG: ribonuclease E [Buchnera aphidicola (Microlophium carnosum)]|uniref:Ribonuclease E n=1 Tax=Buchnera aphidicola (Microlophium carnosum) TaxID=2708354 RepID=A0A6G9JVA4_9GAMM|nr:MAG: ribonuclease E [Buchnera aphidicola (Microlophium carnosum)]